MRIVPPFTLPRIRLPVASGPWAPLAITSSLWLAFLLFGPVLNVPGTPFLAWRSALGPALATVGILSGVALSVGAARPSRLAGATAAILLGWAGTLALYSRWYARHHLSLWFRLPTPERLIGQGLGSLLAGLVLGWLAAWLVRLALARLRVRCTALSGMVLGGLMLACALVLVLVPFAPDHQVTAPLAHASAASLAQIPQRVYVLIKGAMIWVPLGLVLGIAGVSRVPRRWVPAALIGFFVVGWPFFPGLKVSDLMEVLFAPVGIWAGLWLGERTVRSMNLAAAEDRGPVQPEAASAKPARPGRPELFRLPRAALFALAHPSPRALAPALALLALAAWAWWDFPAFKPALGIALLLYLGLLLVFRHAWLILVPAVLPALDLAPWTGRFFFDESDLFLLVTLGAALLHRPDAQAGPFLSRRLAVLGALFAATTLIALVVGLLPLSPLDANAFATYFSHYNALRVGKGFAWGLGFFLLLRWSLPQGSELPARLFTLGLLLGLIGVVLVGVTERSHYGSLLDFSTTYRITATFASMHTGGSHLPAFLALAVPFVWLWMARTRNPLAFLAALALLAGAAYLVIVTVTRASFLALAVELALLALFWLRALKGGDWVRIATSLVAFAGMTVVGGGLLLLGTEGTYFQQRMSTVDRDAGTRLEHWRDAVGMMDPDIGTRLFGMGLGRFPETYLLRNRGGVVPGNFRYASENGDGYLLLGSGETLYLAQRVQVQPFTRYRLSFDLRGDGKHLSITIPLCEKHLLDSRRCVWHSYELPGGKGWQHKEATIDSGEIGSGSWLSTPPVELFLYNEAKNQLLGVDNLSLKDPRGHELLRNGDFSEGGDFWFFRTHEHLAWHIKNLWVSMLFEQGWVGLIVFNLLLLDALAELAGPAWGGRPVPAAAFTAVLGFLIVGLFASPFDAPRLTALFFAVLAIGLRAAERSDTPGEREAAGAGPVIVPETVAGGARLLILAEIGYLPPSEAHQEAGPKHAVGSDLSTRSPCTDTHS